MILVKRSILAKTFPNFDILVRGKKKKMTFDDCVFFSI